MSTDATKRKLCALKDCPDHKGDPEWTHIRSTRDERRPLRVRR